MADSNRPGWGMGRVPEQLHAALRKIGDDALNSEVHPLRTMGQNDRDELPLHKVIAYLVKHLHNDRRRGRESSKRRPSKRAALRGLLAFGLSPRDGE